MAHDQDDETPASPFSSTGFQLSALFLLVLLVAGIAIAIFHGGNGTAKGKPEAGHRHRQLADRDVNHEHDGAMLTAGRQPTGAVRLTACGRDAGNVVGSMSAPQSGALGPQHTAGRLERLLCA